MFEGGVKKTIKINKSGVMFTYLYMNDLIFPDDDSIMIEEFE